MNTISRLTPRLGCDTLSVVWIQAVAYPDLFKYTFVHGIIIIVVVVVVAVVVNVVVVVVVVWVLLF